MKLCCNQTVLKFIDKGCKSNNSSHPYIDKLITKMHLMDYPGAHPENFKGGGGGSKKTRFRTQERKGWDEILN